MQDRKLGACMQFIRNTEEGLEVLIRSKTQAPPLYLCSYRKTQEDCNQNSHGTVMHALIELQAKHIKCLNYCNLHRNRVFF